MTPKINLKLINQDVQRVDFFGVLEDFSNEGQVSSLTFYLYNPFNNQSLELFLDKLDEITKFDIHLMFAGFHEKESIIRRGFLCVYEKKNEQSWGFKIYHRNKCS